MNVTGLADYQVLTQLCLRPCLCGGVVGLCSKLAEEVRVELGWFVLGVCRALAPVVVGGCVVFGRSHNQSINQSRGRSGESEAD